MTNTIAVADEEKSTCLVCQSVDCCSACIRAYRQVGFHPDTWEDVREIDEVIEPWQSRIVGRFLPE